MTAVIVFADAIRVIAISEICFTIGFLAFRVWKNRRNPWRYLSLMAVALVFYSSFAAMVLLTRWNDPLSWRAPLVLLAATISFVAVIREGRKHS